MSTLDSLRLAHDQGFRHGFATGVAVIAVLMLCVIAYAWLLRREYRRLQRTGARPPFTFTIWE